MIELQDVVVAYDERVILDHVNLTIQDGETLAVLGPSGAGKSTVLRLIIGLQKPNSGRILVDGQDVTVMKENEINLVREQMGMVFQYSALFDSMTVGENVAFGLRQHTHRSEEDIKNTVARKLRMVGLTGLEDYMPSELSGGMKKRVGLARAIALDPKVILYDEPTSGLDPITSGTISRLIRSMQRHLNCTSIVVTHDMNSAFFIGDRLALLEEGKFVAVAPPEEFRNSPDDRVQQFIHGRKSVRKGDRQGEFI